MKMKTSDFTAIALAGVGVCLYVHAVFALLLF